MNLCMYVQRERETEPDTHRERERHTDTETDIETDTETDKHRHTYRDRHTRLDMWVCHKTIIQKKTQKKTFSPPVLIRSEALDTKYRPPSPSTNLIS